MIAALSRFTELSLGLSLQLWEPGKTLGSRSSELSWELCLHHRTSLGNTWELQVLPMGQLMSLGACPTHLQLRKAQTPLRELQNKSFGNSSLNGCCGGGGVNCC